MTTYADDFKAVLGSRAAAPIRDTTFEAIRKLIYEGELVGKQVASRVFDAHHSRQMTNIHGNDMQLERGEITEAVTALRTIF